MADIFISYKREDRLAAERVSTALEQLGFDIWWDFELLSGDRFRNVIREVLGKCAAVVVLWSHRSVDSDFVMDEASYAKAKGKICPARIDDVDLPFGFGQTHTDDLSDWDGELGHPGFQSLVRAVEQRVGRKAKIGAAAQNKDTLAASAEMESFKAAQVAGTKAALESFLRRYPSGSFARFVREQLADSPGAAAPTDIPDAPKKKSPLPIVAAVAAVVALAGAGVWLTPKITSGAVAVPSAPAPSAQGALAPSAVPLKPPASEQTPVTAPAASPRPQASIVAEDKPPPSNPFDPAQLDVKVAEAARSARDAEQGAKNVAALARELAITAEKRGTVDPAEGLGIHNATNQGQYGDHYAGEYHNVAFHGYGVYTYALNPANTAKLARFEGRWKSYMRDVSGVLYWRDGTQYAGNVQYGALTGFGVYYNSTDGTRFEGGWISGKSSGAGVKWDRDGRVKEAGIYKDGRLITPLGPQGK